MKLFNMKEKLIFPDYNNCLTNLACSIEKYFGLEYKHNTIEFVDKILEKNNSKNIIVLVYDGLGINVIDNNLDSASFLKNNLKHNISSVFPPTTTAATTSLITGLNPCEHGRIGWDVYFKNLDKIVTIYTNHEKDNESNEFNYNVVNTFLPYCSINEKINKTSNCKAYKFYPFGEGKYENLDDMIDKIIELCKKDGKKCIYAYYDEPDHTLHEKGTSGNAIKNLLNHIDTKTKKLVEELEDCTLFIVADHGHIDCDVITLNGNYPDFIELLERNIAIEGRATTFWVKHDRKAEFEDKFKKYFGEYFNLYTKEEVLKMKIFGDGIFNDNFVDSIGDYLAIAIADKYFEYYYYADHMKSHHAGMTEKEMIIPLFIFHK